MDKLTKLSDAILLGATFKPQGYLYESFIYTKTKSCALGAAADALGLELGEDRSREFAKRFPVLDNELPYNNSQIYKDAEKHYGQYVTLNNVIWLLNDIYRWSREKIAHWLKTEHNL